MRLAFKFDDGRVISHEVFERAFTLGRAESCRVSLPSEHFSREHCLVELVEGAVYVTDLGSKNGIYINHIRLPAKTKTKYDLQLPLYMGEAFVTIDISEDLKDPDHLSLESFTRVDPNEVFRPIDTPVRRVPVLPRAYKEVEVPKKSFLSFTTLILFVLLGVSLFAYQEFRKAEALKQNRVEKTP